MTQQNRRNSGPARVVLTSIQCLGIATVAALATEAYAADQALDTSLKPPEKEEVASVFRDMGVVQRRAMAKGGRFLFSTYGTFDFSDGPYTNYALNVNPGYAFSDFFEMYINIVPKFFVSPRSIVEMVSELQLISGRYASITAALPQSQIGLELLWAPAYGKDSLGIHNVIRSDTFFKLGVSQVTYDTDSGLKILSGLGKSFFIGRSMSFRLCVDFGYLQNTVNGVKSFKGMALLETGMVFYL